MIAILDTPAAQSGIASISGTWVVVCTAPQREKATCQRLYDQGIGHYLPTVKIRRRYASKSLDVESPLYPTYLFATYTNADDYALLLDTQGVSGILPIHAADQAKLVTQLSSLQTALNHDPYLDTSDWCVEGRRVVVVRGPMKNVEGRVIQRRGRDVLLVGIELLGRVVELNVDPLDCEPI